MSRLAITRTLDDLDVRERLTSVVIHGFPDSHDTQSPPSQLNCGPYCWKGQKDHIVSGSWIA